MGCLSKKKKKKERAIDIRSPEVESGECVLRQISFFFFYLLITALYNVMTGK